MDDFATTEPSYTWGSGQAVLWILAGYVIGFAEDKHIPMNQLSVLLGAENDMRYIPIRFEMYVGVTDDRRRKLQALLAPFIGLRAGDLIRLTHAYAAKLFGKSRFVLCPVFGRIGLAALRGLQIRSKAVEVCLGSEVYNTTNFLYRAVGELGVSTYFQRDNANY